MIVLACAQIARKLMIYIFGQSGNLLNTTISSTKKCSIYLQRFSLADQEMSIIINHTSKCLAIVAENQMILNFGNDIDCWGPCVAVAEHDKRAIYLSRR